MTDNLHIPDPSGILAVHASAVCINGEALIFLGPSETGKSTMRRLLSVFSEPLADDRTYLIPQTIGGWAVTGADGRDFNKPLSEIEASALGGAPLRAIFRLYQASEPGLERINALKTCRHLTHAFFELLWQQFYAAGTKETAFASLAAIARSVPGYCLYFDRSPRTAKMINEEANSW